MRIRQLLLPRIGHILLIAIFWGIVSSGPRILNFDGDLPRHILTGTLILQTKHVPTTDIFSFRTAGHSNIPHEWLSQVLFAVVYRWLGLDGIVLLTALVIMLTWGMVYSQSLRISNSLFVALIVTALGAAASQVHVLPRPHILTYLFITVWIALLELIRQNKTQTWYLLPVVMLLWVNMHGMFVVGLAILAIYLVGDFLDHPSSSWFTNEKTKSLLLGGILSLLATFLSPSGPKIWQAIASLGGNAYLTSKIPEYQSANFHLPETWPFIFLLLLTIVGFARATQKISWVQILLVISFAALAVYSSRMIPFFAIVVTPIAAEAIAKWIHQEYSNSRLWTVEKNIVQTNAAAGGLIWALAMILITAVFLRVGGKIDPAGQGNVFDRRFFPVDAVSWLQSHPQEGHMFNEFDWGGYLLLRLWPAYQIFMDGHTHIYGETLTREYEQVVTMRPGWEQILEKYDVDWVIIRVKTSLANALAMSPTWTPVYRDQTAIIFVRR